LFQHITRWIHYARVDVAKFCESKKIGRMFCVTELK
jgi:hypothetical protein